jgi:hypothetical protein
VEAFLQRHPAEIDEQTRAQIEYTEIRQELLGMDGSQLLDRFHFHDDSAVHQKIEPQAVGEMQAIEIESDDLLPFY